MDQQFIEILKTSQSHLQGDNVRLFWQDALDGYTGEINPRTSPVVCAGWHVITWNRTKPVTLYFGDSLESALEEFKKRN